MHVKGVLPHEVDSVIVPYLASPTAHAVDVFFEVEVWQKSFYFFQGPSWIPFTRPRWMYFAHRCIIDLETGEQKEKEATMPHVTSFKFRVKPGEREAVIDRFERWERERKSKAGGFVRGVLVSKHSAPDEFMATVVFDSTESYDANSNSSEQSAWYQELRSHLTADPEWFDGKLEVQMTA